MAPFRSVSACQPGRNICRGCAAPKMLHLLAPPAPRSAAGDQGKQTTNVKRTAPTCSAASGRLACCVARRNSAGQGASGWAAGVQAPHFTASAPAVRARLDPSAPQFVFSYCSGVIRMSDLGRGILQSRIRGFTCHLRARATSSSARASSERSSLGFCL